MNRVPGILTSLILILNLSPPWCPAQRPQWPDLVANQVTTCRVVGLTHGPVVGQVTPTQARIWIRTREPKSFRVLVDTSLPLKSEDAVAEGETPASRDHTGDVLLTSLEPNTRYFYGIEIDGRLADIRMNLNDRWPSFRTLPDKETFRDPRVNPDGKFNVVFAIGHCADQGSARGEEYPDPPAYHTIFREHRDEIQFMLINGDIIYEEKRDGTLGGIRENYKTYWQRGRGLSRLMRNVPMLFTFDDHDIGNDIHGSGAPGMGKGAHLYRDPALRVYREYCGWANYPNPAYAPLRFGKASFSEKRDILVDPDADFSSLDPATVSTIHLGPSCRGGPATASPNAGVYELVEVLDEHRLRIAPPVSSVEDEVEYSIGTHHWYDWKVGNCHFFALDTRGERSKPGNGPDHFILGRQQTEWLLSGVRRTECDFVFIVSPDPWMVHHTALHMLALHSPELLDDPPEKYRRPKGDGFSSFLHQREKLLDALDAVGKPIIIITGDVHNAMSLRVTDNIWEILAGPLNSARHPIGTCGGMPTGGKWNSLGRDVLVRWAAPSPNEVPYWQNHNAFYCIVQVNNILGCPRRHEEGYQWIAYDAPQAVIRFHDAYTGKLVYAESISLAEVK